MEGEKQIWDNMKEETTGLGGRLDPQDEDEGVKDYCKVGGGTQGKVKQKM